MKSEIAFPPYSSYKDSGVGWLGNLPEHWELKRLKYVGEAIIGLTYDPVDITSGNEGVLVLRSSNVQGGKIVFDDNVFVNTPIPKRLITRPEDILLCSRNGSRDLIGKNAMIGDEASGLTFGAFMTVFRSVYNKYIFYVFNSSLFDYQSGTFLTSTVNQLTVGHLKCFEIPMPAADEQQAIVAFLDFELAKIDTLIEKQQQLVAFLIEKRKAVIGHAITKGLNPNVPMKDSGIAWLRKIPQHWDTKALKHIAFLKSGETINSDSINDIGDYAVYGGNGFRGYTDAYTHEGTFPLIGRQGALCGNVNYSIGKFWASEHAVVVTPVRRLATLWLGELLRTMNLNQYSVAAAQPGLSVEAISKLFVPIPPQDEQQAIAKFIDQETAQIDRLIAKAKHSIELMRERRVALISAAVTGKIDVRRVETQYRVDRLNHDFHD